MKSKCIVVVLIASLVLGVLPLQLVQVFCQPIVDGYASGDSPHVNTIERLTDEGWKLVVNDTIAHDHDFSTTDDASDDFWMSVWEACDDAENVYLAFLSNYQLFGVAVWLDFNGDGVFTVGFEPSPLYASLDTPDFPCLYNFTVGNGYTDQIAGASVAYGFNNMFIEIMVPKVEVEGDVNETVWDCMNWNYMVGVDANANFIWDNLPSDWIATGWGSWCTFTDNRAHEMWNGANWVPLQSWFACPCQPSEKCQVTFLTQPAQDGFSINFLGTTYNNGDVGTFINGSSGVTTTNCPDGWVFDHWEVTGEITVSNSNENPAYVEIASSGIIKAVFYPATCQVTFLTDPTSSNFNITFQGKTYYNGTTDTLECGTFGPITAKCPSGWVFDHWETAGYLQVSNTTENPTTVTINCGSIKAVFRTTTCNVTFLTDPACTGFNIKFQCTTYHNGTIGTFNYGTSDLATANCPDGWVFDHWEFTGNIQISSATTNPATVTINCGGTIKAVFRPSQCQVTFYTEPTCDYYYITFQSKNYYNGATDTFAFGTSGLAKANCIEGWVLDHWEATGNVQVSNVTANPTNITICCGGTLKAVFKRPQCQVTFLTDPVCSSFNITFKCKTYHNGTQDVFSYGTSANALANCPSGWVFDHWEVTGNIAVSNLTQNPTCVSINCGGTLKAVFKPVACQVTFYTNPVCNYYYITFQCKNYHNGTTDTFAFGTSGLATANCPSGWEFDHWEVTGNIQISSTTTNPTNITICCGGTLKAVFRTAGCQVTFLTDPVCTDFNIKFQCKTYHNGTTDTFNYGTSGLATANCPDGWVFDHWEVTGNVQVSNTTKNPTDVTICCGGTIKAVFKPLACQVTFLTDPVCNYYYINFQCKNYHNGTTDTFAFGTSGLATANCQEGWVFDHWEVTGNIQISSTTTNPANITICCGGTLKAVFKRPQCQVTFYTNPVCNYYYITFQCKNYHNGTTDTFNYGTSGLATANCPNGWEFDHWEITGNVQVSNVTANPITVTICCGGTLKAVFRQALKPPNADFTWCPTTPKTCETVTFNASASTPDGGVIVSYEWNFGDGNVTTVTTPIVTHHYSSAGSYTVVLNVTDSEGKWDTETKIITVVESCPKACFTGEHHSLTVTFNASSSYDPDGYIVSYRWDFGDGNTTTVAVPIVNHKYAKPGTYNVTLTVIDDNGLSASAEDSITIETFLGDLNGDGRVSIHDIYIMAKAFGTTPGHKNWNPIADLNNDGKIGIEDVYLIAKDFGKTL